MHIILIAFISLIIGIIANIISELILRIIDRNSQRTVPLLIAAVITVISFILLQALLSSSPPSGSSQGNGPTAAPTAGGHPPATSPIPSPSPSPDPTHPKKPGYILLYSKVKISIPGGSCAGSTVVELSSPSGPHVYPGVETLFNDPSKWDITLDNCATDNDIQTLKTNQGSGFTSAVSASSGPAFCAKQITENPEGDSLIPRPKKSVCYQTQKNVFVLLTFGPIDNGSPYVLHAKATAWRHSSS